MRRLARIDLLVDDRGLLGFSAKEGRDLLEIASARLVRKSILGARQIIQVVPCRNRLTCHVC